MKVIVFGLASATATAFGINAAIHFMLAGAFDANPGNLVSQGDLFRVQAAGNIIAAALLVIRPRPVTAWIAATVAAVGLGFVVFTVYAPLDLVSIGGPFLYEPVWYPDKVASAIAQLVAIVGSLLLVITTRRMQANRRSAEDLSC